MTKSISNTMSCEDQFPATFKAILDKNTAKVHNLSSAIKYNDGVTVFDEYKQEYLFIKNGDWNIIELENKILDESFIQLENDSCEFKKRELDFYVSLEIELTDDEIQKRTTEFILSFGKPEDMSHEEKITIKKLSDEFRKGLTLKNEEVKLRNYLKIEEFKNNDPYLKTFIYEQNL